MMELKQGEGLLSTEYFLIWKPSHEPYQSQDEVIEYLCKEELTLEIAKDIAKNGLNPLELCA